jgi:hypothetical protein
MMIMPGCLPEIPKPDLLPVNPDNWVNFCDADNSGNLLVHIKNQGTATAGPSTLEVDFGQQAPTLMPVPSLLAGGTTTILVPFPYGCYNPDCDFEITVDSTDVIDESNELNNSQTGSCLG